MLLDHVIALLTGSALPVLAGCWCPGWARRVFSPELPPGCPWGLAGVQHYQYCGEAMTSAVGVSGHLLAAHIPDACILGWTWFRSNSPVFLKLHIEVPICIAA